MSWLGGVVGVVLESHRLAVLRGDDPGTGIRTVVHAGAVNSRAVAGRRGHPRRARERGRGTNPDPTKKSTGIAETNSPRAPGRSSRLCWRTSPHGGVGT